MSVPTCRYYYYMYEYIGRNTDVHVACCCQARRSKRVDKLVDYS